MSSSHTILLSAIFNYSTTSHRKDVPKSTTTNSSSVFLVPHCHWKIQALLATSRQLGDVLAPRCTSKSVGAFDDEERNTAHHTNVAPVDDKFALLLATFFPDTARFAVDASLSFYVQYHPKMTEEEKKDHVARRFESVFALEKRNNNNNNNNDNNNSNNAASAQTNSKNDEKKVVNSSRLFDRRQLHRLNLGQCSNVTKSALQYLIPYRNIEALDLSFAQISDAGGELQNIICPNMTHLRELSLYQCHGVGIEGAKAIARNLKHLACLSFRENDSNFNTSMLEALCDPDTSYLCESLTKLDLSENTFLSCKETVEILCNGMRSLRSLNLTNVGTLNRQDILRDEVRSLEEEQINPTLLTVEVSTNDDENDQQKQPMTTEKISMFHQADICTLDLVDSAKSMFAHHLEEIIGFPLWLKIPSGRDWSRRNCLAQFFHLIGNENTTACLRKLVLTHSADISPFEWSFDCFDDGQKFMSHFFRKPHIANNLRELDFSCTDITDDMVVEAILKNETLLKSLRKLILAQCLYVGLEGTVTYLKYLGEERSREIPIALETVNLARCHHIFGYLQQHAGGASKSGVFYFGSIHVVV